MVWILSQKLILLALFLPLCPVLSGTSELQQRIEMAVARCKASGARIGIHVLRLDTGESLCAIRADESFIPASNLKLFTTAAALEILGSDFNYETPIWTSGKISAEGVLSGDVILQGSGDPNISGRFWPKPTSLFEMCAKEFRKRGIRRIEGSVVADDYLFDREWVHPEWPQDQLSFWYCAQISALSFNDNCVEITVIPGSRAGARLRVACLPATSYVTFDIRAKTGPKRSKSAVWFRRNEGTNAILVGGKHPSGGTPFTDFVTIHNPSLFAANVLTEVLEKKGIPVSGQPRLADRAMPRPPKAQVLALFSTPIGRTIRVTNKQSQNFYAEQLLKTLGAVKYGKGSFRNGVKAVRAFIAGTGLNSEGMELVDGSGLARGNRVSPRQVTALLSWAISRPFSSLFLDSLPVGGKDGTLATRFRKKLFEGRIFAKSGYIRGVSALSGYLGDDTGPQVAFSILANDFKGSSLPVKKVQEAVCNAVLGSDP